MSGVSLALVIGWLIIAMASTVGMLIAYRRLVGLQRRLIGTLTFQLEQRGLAIRALLTDMDQLVDRSLLDEDEAIDARMRIAICDEMVRKQDAGEWEETEVPS